jgi:putative acetyltransferase
MIGAFFLRGGNMKFEEIKKISKKGKTITFKMLQTSDAKIVIETMASVAETSPYILRSAEEFRKTSIEDEEKWIENHNNNERGGVIGAFHEDRLMGIVDFGTYKSAKMNHRALLGISLHQDYRGEGIGELFFEILFILAKRIPNLDGLELSVMGDNKVARALYKKMGFVEIGLNPKAFRQADGTFIDDVKMLLKW